MADKNDQEKKLGFDPTKLELLAKKGVKPPPPPRQPPTQPKPQPPVKTTKK